TLMGSGALLPEVVKAAQQLHSQGVSVHVVSVTSWSELARDGQRCDQARLQGLLQAGGQPFVTTELAAHTQGPVVAVSDYVRMVPESIRACMPEGRGYLTLGTDGFGRSDTRSALRQFFGVDANAIVRGALVSLGLV